MLGSMFGEEARMTAVTVEILYGLKSAGAAL